MGSYSSKLLYFVRIPFSLLICMVINLVHFLLEEDHHPRDKTAAMVFQELAKGAH